MLRRCSAVLFLAGILHPAVGHPQEGVEPSLPDLSGVPAPLLEEFEPTVRSQLATTRDAVESAVAGERGAEASRAFATLCLVYLRYELMSAAEPCLEQLRALEPQDHRWPYYQSILYDRNGLFDRALASAEAALELHRDDLPTLIRTARLRYRTGNLAAAQAGYRAVLALDPTSSAAFYGRGRLAADRGDARAAIDDFERALAGQPPGTIIHHHLGMAYRALGDFERARAELTRNRQLAVVFPDPLGSQLGRLGVSREEIFKGGVMAARDGRPQDAARAFREVLAAVPEDADAHYNLARALIDLDDLPTAETHLRRAVAARKYPAAHYNLSILLGRTGRVDEAAEALDRAIDADPENLEWRVMRARLVAQGGDLPRAIESLDEIVTLDPGLPAARRALGAMLMAQGAHRRAVDTYRELVTLVPNDPEGRIGLGLSLLRSGDVREALATLEAAIVLLPEEVELRHLLARLLASSPDTSLRDGQRALALAEPVVELQLTLDHAETLAMALAEVGRYEEAAAWQQRVLREENRSGGAVVEEQQRRLELYRSGRAYHAEWSL